MQHSTNLKQGELLSTQNYVNDPNREPSGNAPVIDKSKNTQLIEKEELEGTPFWMIKDEKGYFLVYGELRVTPQYYETAHECKIALIEEQWQIIPRVSAYIAEKVFQNNVNLFIEAQKDAPDINAIPQG